MSWAQLIAIRDEQVQTVLAEIAAPPVACPYDGEPLREGPDGVLFCPFGSDTPDGDHYQWPRDGKP